MRLSVLNATCLSLLLVTLTIDARRTFAEDPLQVLPTVERVPGLKTPEQFYGFEVGSRHLRHEQVVSYLEYLSENSSRVSIESYGKTHGQRPLLVAAISSPANIQKLPAIRSTRRQLASGSPVTSTEEELLVMSMGYCVHGDEASGINAVPLLAYHLASANDAETIRFLDRSIALIDPALNPDGSDRFASWANENRGLHASATPIDREHIQNWPGGRTNYYYFDLNRDWLPAVHPESQGRIKLFHSWKPNVVLDFHEMGGNSSFFFQPGELKSINPYSPKENLRITQKFAKAHIEAMDRSTELFYSEENFDDFYIGKGSTYPDLQGSIGILFEQASSRGLQWANDRVSRHFRDTVANQLRLSLSSIRAASDNHAAILKLQTEFFQNALRTAKTHSVKAYILHGSTSRLAAAIKTLKLHTIRVYKPESDVVFDDKRYDQNSTVIIPLDQPQHFLIRSLFEPAQNFERNVFYDVSTWHFPSAFDLLSVEVKSDVPDQWRAKPAVAQDYLALGDLAKQEVGDGNNLAWIIPPTELQTPKAILALQRIGAKVRVATLPFQSGERRFPQGSYVILKQPNQQRWEKINQSLPSICQRESVACYPLRTGSTTVGPDLGSDTLIDLPNCRPLVVMGNGTTSYSAGSLWYFVDNRLRHPIDKVDVDRLTSVDFENYSCVLLPEGSYSTLTESAAQALEEYVKGGGTVIAIGSSIGALQRRKLIRGSEVTADSTETSKDSANGGKRRFADADDESALETIAGAFFEVSVDDTHPLAFGFPDSRIPVFRTSTRRYPVPANSYQLVARYESVIAGYVSQRNREQLKSSAAAWVQSSGSGNYILIADNPVFRGYVRGAERFLTNAMLIGPAFNLPSGGSGDGEHD